MMSGIICDLEEMECSIDRSYGDKLASESNMQNHTKEEKRNENTEFSILNADLKEVHCSGIEVKPCYVHLTKLSTLSVKLSSSNQTILSHIKIENDQSSILGCTEYVSESGQSSILGCTEYVSENFIDQHVKVGKNDHSQKAKDNVKIKTGAKNIKNQKHTCSKCGALFSNRQNVTRHVKNIHFKQTRKDKLKARKSGTQNKKQKHTCSICGTLFSNKQNVTRHVKNIHFKQIRKDKLKARKSTKCSKATENSSKSSKAIEKIDKCSEAIQNFDNFMVWKYNMQCLLCKEVFKDRSKFKQHIMKEEHCVNVYKISKDGVNYFHCPPCNWSRYINPCRSELGQDCFMNHLVGKEQHGDMGCVNVPREINTVFIGDKRTYSAVNKERDHRTLKRGNDGTMYDKSDSTVFAESDSTMNSAVSKNSDGAITLGSDNALSKMGVNGYTECDTSSLMKRDAAANKVSGKGIAINMGLDSEMNQLKDRSLNTRSDNAIYKAVTNTLNTRIDNTVDCSFDAQSDSAVDNSKSKDISCMWNGNNGNTMNGEYENAPCTVGGRDKKTESGNKLKTENEKPLKTKTNGELNKESIIDIDIESTSLIESNNSSDAENGRQFKEGDDRVVMENRNALCIVGIDNVSKDSVGTQMNMKGGWQCKVCNMEIRTWRKGPAILHIRKCHTEEQTIQCSICYRYFESYKVLNIYMESKHKDNSAAFLCSICGKVYKSANLVKSHENRVHHKIKKIQKHHTTDKMYSCSICKKTFSSGYNMSRHEKTHTTTRNFICEICGNAYKSGKNLKIHIVKRHSDINSKDVARSLVNCSVCDKVVTKNSMLLHMKIHKDRKISCDICNAKFVHKHHLQYHMAIHTGERSFKCQICGGAFNLKHRLDSHLKRKHDILSER